MTQESKSSRRTSPSDVRAFRQKHGLTQPALDRLMGFKSGGAAVGRWEREGAPYYVTLLFKLVEEHGIDLLYEIADRGDFNARRTDVQRFREKYKLTGAETDALFGLSSGGRATRRWEHPLERGAPSYITIMMHYCERFGCETLMQSLRRATSKPAD